MSPGQRSELALEMSNQARKIALDAIRHRHPGYDDAEARWALFRLLLGDELFRRAWPRAPLLRP
jgi:hypothetical protein